MDGDVIQGDALLYGSEQWEGTSAHHEHLHLHLHVAGDEHSLAVGSYGELHYQQLPQLSAMLQVAPTLSQQLQVEPALFFPQSYNLFLWARLYTVDSAAFCRELVLSIESWWVPLIFWNISIHMAQKKPSISVQIHCQNLRLSRDVLHWRKPWFWILVNIGCLTIATLNENLEGVLIVETGEELAVIQCTILNKWSTFLFVHIWATVLIGYN